MARIFSEGFETGSHWAASTTGGVSVTTTNARISGWCLSFVAGSSATFAFPQQSEFYLTFAIRRESGTARVLWLSGTNEVGRIEVSSTSSKITLYIGGSAVATGNRVLPWNAWIVLQMYIKIADSGGRVVVYVDGVKDIDYTGDTKPGTFTTVDLVKFDCPLYSSFRVDDIFINDTSGTTDNTYPDGNHIYGLVPTSDTEVSGLKDKQGGTSNIYQSIDEQPHNSDTDYIWGDTSGQYGLFGCADLPSLPAGASVVSVWVEAVATKTDANGANAYLGVSEGGTTTWGDPIPLSTSYNRIRSARYTTNPRTGSPWSAAQVGDISIGFKLE